MRKQFIPNKLKVWIDARRKFHLNDAQIQMARELGLNPKKFGSLNNHRQEPWKQPLPMFIETLYQKRFGRKRPEVVMSIESKVKEVRKKKKDRRLMKTTKIGVAWYRPDQWEVLLKKSDDRDNLEDTFEEWQSIAESRMKELHENGIKAEKVLVDVEDLIKWCLQKNLRLNASARSQFVAEQLHNRDLSQPRSGP